MIYSEKIGAGAVEESYTINMTGTVVGTCLIKRVGSMVTARINGTHSSGLNIMSASNIVPAHLRPSVGTYSAQYVGANVSAYKTLGVGINGGFNLVYGAAQTASGDMLVSWII